MRRQVGGSKFTIFVVGIVATKRIQLREGQAKKHLHSSATSPTAFYPPWIVTDSTHPQQHNSKPVRWTSHTQPPGTSLRIRAFNDLFVPSHHWRSVRCFLGRLTRQLDYIPHRSPKHNWRSRTYIYCSCPYTGA